MKTFLSYLYEILGQFFSGFAAIFGGIIDGFAKIFNVKNLFNFYITYKNKWFIPDFTLISNNSIFKL